MATYTRKNAWNQGGTFSNTDLLWYAKGVGVMQSRHLDDPTSWWFYASIHGQLITRGPAGYPRWSKIPGTPKVPVTPLPSQSLINQYWDQCQHGTWFFPPWHRGYLYAIENILRGIIVGLGGPGSWALPYWNYFGTGNEYKIPPAFTQPKLPDGTANPLLVTARYGYKNDGIIVIPLAQWGITQDCQLLPAYTGIQPSYYGGDVTGFEHPGPDKRGTLEDNPHGAVHVAVGGQNPAGIGGLMTIPDTAALDPIFYLHHCNIDRMWDEWNASGKTNPADSNWLNGPVATGDRKFLMPKPDKTPWSYTAKMVNDISQLDYTYEPPTHTVAPALVSKNAMRLLNFGFPLTAVKNITDMDSKTTTELVGANNAPLTIDASGGRTTVKLADKGWKAVTQSLNKVFNTALSLEALPGSLPDQVFLQLEGIKGKEDSIVCSVSVNHHYAGHITLFGLSNASSSDSPHGGAGMTTRLDITKIVDKLHLNGAIEASSLDVLIQPVNLVAAGNELTIDRISVYRQGQ